MMPSILYDERNIIVVHKPAGLPVQRDQTGDTSLLELLADLQEEKLYLIHRIDRPVSGLVALARTKPAAKRWQSMLQQRGLRREYVALVEGHPDEPTAELIHGLRHDTQNHKARILPVDDPRAKRSILHYYVLEQGDRYSALHITLDTGRFHQIRAQLAEIGHPIRGDVKYGARRGLKDRSIDLCAWKLSWDHHTVVGELPSGGLWEMVR